MKRIYILIGVVSIIVFLSGCGQEDVRLPVTEEKENQLIDLVFDYKHTLINSVNEGNFNHLEPFLITNHGFYHSVRRYISDARSKMTQMELIEMEVEDVYKNDFGEFFVDVSETVETTEGRQDKISETMLLTYVIVEYHNDNRIMTVKVR